MHRFVAPAARRPDRVLLDSPYGTKRRVPDDFLRRIDQQWNMPILSRRAQRAIPTILGAVNSSMLPSCWCGTHFRRFFPLAATTFWLPFAGRDCARIHHVSVGAPPRAGFVKAALLAAAFLFWAANQFWPDSKQATLWNYVAIALFVLDVFLVMIGWPAASGDESFAQTHAAEVADGHGEAGNGLRAMATAFTISRYALPASPGDHSRPPHAIILLYFSIDLHFLVSPHIFSGFFC